MHKICEAYLCEAQSRIIRDMHSKYFPRGIIQMVGNASEYMPIKFPHPTNLAYTLNWTIDIKPLYWMHFTQKLILSDTLNVYKKYLICNFYDKPTNIQLYHNINIFLYSLEHDPNHMVDIWLIPLNTFYRQCRDITYKTHQRNISSLQQRPFYCHTFKDTCPCLTICILTDKP